jgi:hypothetical protein
MKNISSFWYICYCRKCLYHHQSEICDQCTFEPTHFTKKSKKSHNPTIQHDIDQIEHDKITLAKSSIHRCKELNTEFKRRE